MINNHYMFDGHNISNSYMRDEKDFADFVDFINTKYLNGKTFVVPYFNGKIKEDGGLSGCILSNGKHFTCHTFSFHKSVYIDGFGLNNMETDIQNYFPSVTTEDNSKSFGTHVIVETPQDFNISRASETTERLVDKIEMTKISPLITNEYENGFDLMQLIAESHLSCHRIGLNTYFDIFSCKEFSIESVKEVLGKNISLTKVKRRSHINV